MILVIKLSNFWYYPLVGISFPRDARLWLRHARHRVLRARGLRHVHGQGRQLERRGLVILRRSRRRQERSLRRITSCGFLQEDSSFGN